MLNHKGTQIIKTNRLTLRRFTIDDSRDAFEKWTSSPEISRFVMKCPHKRIIETEQLLAECVSNYTKVDFYMWGIVIENELIGYICGND